MKQIFLSLLFLFIIQNLSFAQDKKAIYFGSEAGIGLSKFDSYPIVEQESTPSFVLGIFGKFEITKILSLKTGLQYESKIIKSTFEYFDVFENNTRKEPYYLSFNYVSLPLTASFNVTKKSPFYFSTGLTLNYLANSNVEFLYYFNDIKENTTLEYKPFDVGLNAGIGAALDLNKKINLNLDVRSNFGLNSIPKSLYNSGTLNSFYFQIGLGYKIR